MDCDTAREALSAKLDNEDAGVAGRELDRHLARCPSCTAWYSRAATLNRMVRMAPVHAVEPDLTAAILARVPLPRRDRRRVVLAAMLIIVAVAQLGLALSGLFTPPMGMSAAAASIHMDHESAAFNLAFGVLLLLVGLAGRRAVAHLPVLASFVGVLAVTSVIDVADGDVRPARLVTHLPVLFGLALTVALARRPAMERGPADPPDRVGHPIVPEFGRRRPGRPPAARRHVA